MNIGRHTLGGTECFIVAEIGSNHCGDTETGNRLIRAAAEAGVSAVKIQKRNNRTLYTRGFYEAAYNSENAYGRTYGTHREALEPTTGQVEEWQATASDHGVELFSTAFDEASVDFCVQANMPAIKLASGALKDPRLIRYAAATGLPILLSTGGGTFDDVARAVECCDPQNLAVLQCTASYPCGWDELDLGVVGSFQRAFGSVVGVSLHTNGISAGPVAYALGARVIEMHVTLDRTMKGTDHAFSLEPQGLRKLVRDVRRTEAAIGDGVKKVHDSEVAPLTKMRRGAVASRDLPAGHTLERGDILMRIPGVVHDPDSLTGRTLAEPVQAEDPFREEVLCQPISVAS